MRGDRVKKAHSQERLSKLHPHTTCGDMPDGCDPPQVNTTLAENVYRTARAVHEAKAAVSDLISRLSARSCGGDECGTLSGGLVADAAAHAEEAEELVRLVHELTALIGAK